MGKIILAVVVLGLIWIGELLYFYVIDRPDKLAIFGLCISPIALVAIFGLLAEKNHTPKAGK